jgi:hypothetical protein
MMFEAIAVLLLSQDFHFALTVGNYVFFRLEKQAIYTFFFSEMGPWTTVIREYFEKTFSILLAYR